MLKGKEILYKSIKNAYIKVLLYKNIRNNMFKILYLNDCFPLFSNSKFYKIPNTNYKILS